MTRLLAILLLLPEIASAAGLGVYNPAQHAVNGFMPTQLPRCYLWIRPETCGLTNGANVFDVKDFSANGMTASRGSASATPTLANENGRQVFKFDGVDDYLFINNFNSFSANWSNGISVYFVAKWIKKTPTGNNNVDIQTLIDNNHNANVDSFVAQDAPYFSGATNQLQFGRLTATGLDRGAWASNSIANGDFNSISCILNYTNFSIYKNNVLSGTGTGQQNIATNSVNATLNLGRAAVHGRYLGGSIGEVIILHGALTEAQSIQTSRYLGTKYGIVVK